MEIEPSLEYGFLRPDGSDLSEIFPSYGDTRLMSGTGPYDGNFDASSDFFGGDSDIRSNYFSDLQVSPRVSVVNEGPYGRLAKTQKSVYYNTPYIHVLSERYIPNITDLFYAMIATKLEKDWVSIKEHILDRSFVGNFESLYEEDENHKSTGYMVICTGADSIIPFRSLLDTYFINDEEIRFSVKNNGITSHHDIIKYLLKIKNDETLVFDLENSDMCTVDRITLPDLLVMKNMRDELQGNDYHRLHFNDGGTRTNTAIRATMVGKYGYLIDENPLYKDLYVAIAKQSRLYNCLTGNFMVYGLDGLVLEARILQPGAPHVDIDLDEPMLEILFYNDKDDNGNAKSSRFKLADIMKQRDAYAIYREIYEGECPDIIGTKSVDPVPVGIV